MQTTTVGAKKVSITWTTDRYQVTPNITVSPEEILEFANDTEGIVRIQVSKSEPLSEDEFSVNPHDSHFVTVRHNASGTYPYAVYCFARGVFGRGKSMPIIIVDKD